METSKCETKKKNYMYLLKHMGFGEECREWVLVYLWLEVWFSQWGTFKFLQQLDGSQAT